jgi:glycogen synthase
MRLLVCTYEYFPYGSGVANVTHAVVEALRKKGIEVTVCAPEGGDINLGGSSLIS